MIPPINAAARSIIVIIISITGASAMIPSPDFAISGALITNIQKMKLTGRLKTTPRIIHAQCFKYRQITIEATNEIAAAIQMSEFIILFQE